MLASHSTEQEYTYLAATANKFTKEELEFRENLANRLTSIDGKIDILNVRLEPLIKLSDIVVEHDRQIQRWKGVNTILAALFAAAVTIISHWYIKFKGSF